MGSKSINTDNLLTKNIFITSSNNTYPQAGNVLVSDGTGNTFWSSVTLFANPAYNVITGDERWRLYDERRNADCLPFRGASSRHSYTHFHRPSCELLDSWLTDTNAENWVQAMYVIARHQGRHLHCTQMLPNVIFI
jgi:hypothetical protein